MGIKPSENNNLTETFEIPLNNIFNILRNTDSDDEARILEVSYNSVTSIKAMTKRKECRTPINTALN